MAPTFLKELKYEWKLFLSTYDKSLNYFKSHVGNTELIDSHNYINKINNDSVAYKNNLYILHTNEMIYGNLKNINGKWRFLDFIDEKYYDVYNIVFLNKEMVIYFFNKSNPTFIVQAWIYAEVFYIGYLKCKKIIQISHSTSGVDCMLNNIENFLPNIQVSSIECNILSDSKQFYFFGFASNIGHHLFNEISGLLIFLQNPDNFQKIQGICIGPYDYFNIKTYLVKKYNFKIIVLDNSNSYLKLNIYPIFLNSFILDKNQTVPFFNELIENNNYKIEDTSTTLDDKPILEIVMDIRTVSRVLENMTKIYVNIIKMLYDKYYQKYTIKIYFCGRFTTMLNNINIDTDNEYIQQINIMRNIIKLVNIPNIMYENLLGRNIMLIFNKIQNIKFAVCIGGTSVSNLMNWIYNTYSIYLCNTRFHTLVHNIQYDSLNNYSFMTPPIQLIKDTQNENFIIDCNQFLLWFLEVINSFNL
jgi:hypothetical protein